MSNNTKTQEKALEPIVAKQSTDLAVIDLDRDSKKGIALIADKYKDITTLDSAVDTLNGLACSGREVWIHTSLIVHKALSGLTAKKRAETIQKLGSAMRYGKSQLYKFRTAGEKLLKGDFKVLPLTINEFMTPDSKPTDKVKINNFVQIGQYVIDDSTFIIYKGDRINDKEKASTVYFTTSNDLKADTIDILTVGEQIGDKTKFKVEYACGTKEQKTETGVSIVPIMVDIQIMTL